MIWRFSSQEMTFEKVRIMGVLNVTPDSFSDGGEFFSEEKAVQRALEMEREGADLIDIGGESTRPGAQSISTEEELSRILPIVSRLQSRIRVPISVDTTKPLVARAVLKVGASIINDVDGLGAAGEMAELAREFEVGLILMHRRGNPQTMQQLTQYEDVVEEVFDELDKSFSEVLSYGIHPDQIILDPGIGFAKTAEQNLELIARLRRFHSWGRPILVGPSRKSFIGALTGKSSQERDWGTAAAVSLAVTRGAHMIRVHRVAEMKDVIKVTEGILQAENQTHVRS
ncbi:MAG: dihydropteroate synthase [Candidatus Omnitrophica bacterium]|nr:dihydropteroate synthase [Candidatus Omnitrophota bacterium]